MDGATDDLAEVALHARAAIAQAAREILAEAERACGSHPFATGGRLDRARRDLELFLLQHRLDPALAAAGAQALASRPERAVTAVEHFEAQYRAEPDPWGYHRSAYEQAKYAATLAACGPGPFTDALELGGSIGVFSAQLAPRCRRLTTIDFSATAVRRARAALARQPQAQRRPRRHSRGSPGGPV